MNATAALLAVSLGAGLALTACQSAGDRNPPASAAAAPAERKQPDCARADSMDPLCRTTSCVAIEGNFCDL